MEFLCTKITGQGRYRASLYHDHSDMVDIELVCTMIDYSDMVDIELVCTMINYSDMVDIELVCTMINRTC